jgi:putative nucleotidyltransferase with HDIG domain
MQDPRQHAAEIVRIVRSDQALSTRLIRLGNSAYYHGAQPVADISSALRRVGFQAVETLVVAASTRDVFRPRTAAEAGIMASLWDHAVAVAVAAKWIARETGKVDPERAFLGGLVHDIGRALVLRVFDEALARAQGGRKDVPVERIIALIGVHHAELGGVLLEKWAFPPDEVLAARGHHAPLELPGEEPLPAVVGLADLVARKAGMDAGAEEPDGQVWHRLAAHLGMSDAKLASLLVELEDLQTEIKQLLPA